MRTIRLALSGLVAAALAVSMTSPATGAHAQSASARQATPFEVTARASTSELVLGRKLTITGRVSPKSAGKTVDLQKKIGDKPWKVEDTTTLSRRGKYSFTDEPTTIQARKYRVVKAASKRHDRGVSNVLPVTMYRWHYVVDLDSRDSQAMFTKTLTIDTVEFTKSLYGSAWEAGGEFTGFRDYNLARECIRLKSTYGMSDDADTDSSARLDVVADGTNLYSATFALLESDRRTLDLHGVFRLSFEFESLTEHHAEPAVASARVLCAN